MLLLVATPSREKIKKITNKWKWLFQSDIKLTLGQGQGKVNIRSKIWNMMEWLPICLILKPTFQGVQDNNKSYGYLSEVGLTKVNRYTFSLILAYNISPTDQLSLIKVLKHRTFLMMILIGIPVGWMVLDKQSPNFFAKTLKIWMIIILACPSVTRKTLFFNFFIMNCLPRWGKHSKRMLFGMCPDVV